MKDKISFDNYLTSAWLDEAGNVWVSKHDIDDTMAIMDIDIIKEDKNIKNMSLNVYDSFMEILYD